MADELNQLERQALDGAKQVHPGRPMREVWMDEERYARLAAFAWGET